MRGLGAWETARAHRRARAHVRCTGERQAAATPAQGVQVRDASLGDSPRGEVRAPVSAERTPERIEVYGMRATSGTAIDVMDLSPSYLLL
jgi:hypothetical protein